MPGGQSYVYRSQILNNIGTQWLSVPTTCPFGASIRDVMFADAGWAQRHLKTLRMIYGRCRYFPEIFDFIEPLYASAGKWLSAFNQRLIVGTSEYLGLLSQFEESHNLDVPSCGDRRLIEIVKKLGGTAYVSGPGGQKYQDPEHFRLAEVDLEVRRYVPIPYPQGKRAFVGGLSVLDALFHLGPRTRDLLRYDLAEDGY